MAFRRRSAAVAAALVVVAPTAFAASGERPSLTASAPHGRVTVDARFSADESPALVEVATSPRLLATGFAPGALVLRAHLPADDAGAVHYRSQLLLRPGTYWAAVAGRLLDATSCMPIRRGADCNLVWSRAVPVRAG